MRKVAAALFMAMLSTPAMAFECFPPGGVDGIILLGTIVEYPLVASRRY
jgi:hypothetical protein